MMPKRLAAFGPRLRDRDSGASRASFAGTVLLSIVALVPSTALAQYFSPTQSEWLTWPEFCRAKHVARVGNDSQLGSPISQAEVESWELRMREVWAPLHHYCWGLSKVNRALREPGDRRAFFINDAVGEFRYFIERVPRTHPLYADAAAQSCTAFSKIGQLATALKHCEIAIQAQPENGIGYMAKAAVLRQQKRTDEALEVLQQGNTATNGESAEIHNFLGLAYLEHKQYDQARQHARDAYRLGYPLPALRDRLREAGYPLD